MSAGERALDGKRLLWVTEAEVGCESLHAVVGRQSGVCRGASPGRTEALVGAWDGYGPTDVGALQDRVG